MADAVWLIEAGTLRWFTEDASRVQHWQLVIGAKVTRYVKESEHDEADRDRQCADGTIAGAHAETGKVDSVGIPRSLDAETVHQDSVVRILGG